MSKSETKQFEKEFEEFKAENPAIEKRKTDDTYYELMAWYDNKRGNFEIDGGYSDEARDFANCVWNKIHAQELRPKMQVRKHWDGDFSLENVYEDELRALREMILSAGLEERRVFDGVKRQIDKYLEEK